MLECLVEPLTDKLDEWKKKVFILEKEHNKGIETTTTTITKINF